MSALSKKYKNKFEKFSSLAQSVDFKTAVEFLNENNEDSSNFDETFELSINLGIDPRHADQALRGVMLLPQSMGYLASSM